MDAPRPHGGVEEAESERSREYQRAESLLDAIQHFLTAEYPRGADTGYEADHPARDLERAAKDAASLDFTPPTQPQLSDEDRERCQFSIEERELLGVAANIVERAAAMSLAKYLRKLASQQPPLTTGRGGGQMSGVWIFGGSDPRHEDAVKAIVAERSRQDQLKTEGRFKHTCADAEMSHHERHTCLSEEVGEVAEAVLTFDGLAQARARNRAGDDHVTHLREELIQVAAIALAWLESDDLNPPPPTQQHPTPPPVVAEEGEQ